VAGLDGNRVEVAIIPHTIEVTNLQSLKKGDLVNLEVDMIAKYVEKMMRPSVSHSITIKELVRQGF
jgi:riboflavin synthase